MDAHEVFDFNLQKPGQSESDFFHECCELLDKVDKWTMIIFIPSMIILGISSILKWQLIGVFTWTTSIISGIAFTATYDIVNTILKIKRKLNKK